MLNQNLIFSEKWSARIKRHLLFWVVWGFYFGILHAANPFGQSGISGAIAPTSGAVSLKFFKHWYLNEQRNLQLQKEKAYTICHEPEVFVVNLRLELSRDNKTTVPIVETTSTLRYA